MRLTCREVAANAQDLIDGELAFGARLATRVHLLICRNCRANLGRWRQTIRLVDAAVARAGSGSTDDLAALLAQRAAAATDTSRTPPIAGGR